MAYCKNCINAIESNLPEGGLYCTMFRSLCGDTIGCSSGVDGKRKAKTNADRIRFMTDEELAEFLLNRDLDVVEDVSKAVGFTYKVDRELCLANVIDWLRQEADHE